jgi:hypothetical protein
MGPSVTILDGCQAGSVVTFQSNEGPDSILHGFAITNGSAQEGGGICCSSSSPVIWNNIIAVNTAGSGGGLFAGNGSLPSLMTNTFYNNLACEGGGMCCLGSSPRITNSVFLGNAADSGGGLFAGAGASPLLTNNTFFGNWAVSSGGGVESGVEFVEFWNTILWDNAAPAGPEIHGTNTTASHCDVKGGWPGTGNLDVDPCLKDPGAGDLRLTPDSPCIEAGDNDAPALPASDFEGDPRKVYDHVDMGVDEYNLGGVVWIVPDEYPTIQAAIDVTLAGDVVVVKPGTYMENIDLLGKAITVKSEKGPGVTLIDGNQSGSGVVITNESAVLDGFTITNGNALKGGGVYVSFATVQNNILAGNLAKKGGGIWSTGASKIANNLIMENTATRGGGIYSLDNSPLIVNNIISMNTAITKGGGIYCRISPRIINNTIHGNSAEGEGGGIYKTNASASPTTVTNTILWNNTAETGKEIFIGYYWDPATVNISYSNVKGGQSSVYLDPDCTLNWGPGMIDADPLLLDPQSDDYHLSYTSPCIDAGDNHAASLPVLDFEGDPRVFPGNGKGVYLLGSPPPGAIVDMGADEYCLLKRQKSIPK